MSAYEIHLVFEHDFMGAGHAAIAVRDPCWPEGERLTITPECMGEVELTAQVNRIKNELDRQLAAGARKFKKARAAGVAGASDDDSASRDEDTQS